MIKPESLDLSALPSLPLSDRKQFPPVSCIYFAMSNETVQYIGRANNLCVRWANHHRALQLEAMEQPNVAYMECPKELLDEVERALIAWFDPPLNSAALCIEKPAQISPVKQLREAKNFSQRDLALRLHITDRAVSNWERGVNQPKLEAWQFYELCKMLECQLADLVPVIGGDRNA